MAGNVARLVPLLLLISAICASAQTELAARIGHTDPSKYRHSRSHLSAGDMACELLVPPTALNINLNFMHRCQIMPGGGVGHHFHNVTEEMFIVFDGQAEFTIDGRTSVLKGTVGAPVRMGHSHAIYNPSDKPVEFMNINVAMMRGHYDATDLHDSRVGASIDVKPEFMTMRLDRKLLRPVSHLDGGEGIALYRRVLGGDTFATNWTYVDHLFLPQGASEGEHASGNVEEIYYVLGGEGQVRINDQATMVHKGDAVPVRVNEKHSFASAGAGGLELMVVGVARVKFALDTQFAQ